MSRPTSENSSLDTVASSAVSGATFARALMANTFVFSGAGPGTGQSTGRDSRYRSGASTLTRSDSATLPKSDFASMQSQHRSVNSWSLEAPSEPSAAEGVPPVPGNAEQVYVPPQTQRDRESGERSVSRSPPALRVDETAAGTPSLASAIASALAELPSIPSPTSTSTFTSSSSQSPHPSGVPYSGKELENFIDNYYSITDQTTPSVVSPPPPPDERERQRPFQPPFSPITEETTAQLTPATPYNTQDATSALLGIKSPSESTKSSPSPPAPKRNTSQSSHLSTDKITLPSGRTSASTGGGTSLFPLPIHSYYTYFQRKSAQPPPF